MKKSPACNALIFIFLSLSLTQTTYSYKDARLVVVFVVDQLSYHFLQKVSPHLRGGLKLLLQEGIVYNSAYQPHAMPATATGHTGLATGTLPSQHGIIRNEWRTPDGKLLQCDEDSSPKSVVIDPRGGTYNYGVSGHNILVDSVSDQFMLTEKACEVHKVFSFSSKSRAAVCTAGTLGKAMWLDTKSGLFTSSKAYFDQLPQWLTNYNRSLTREQTSRTTWQLAQPCKPRAYFTDSLPETLGGKLKNKNSRELFISTPQADALLLDCAHKCIKAEMKRHGDERMLLWISLSALDLVGHKVGPYSLEAIDIIYHLDQQLKKFIKKICRSPVKSKETAFILTSDHGVSPTVENLQKKGLHYAQRINTDSLVKQLNGTLVRKCEINNLIIDFRTPQLYFDRTIWDTLAREKKELVFATLKKELLAHPAIVRVWTQDELLNSAPEPTQLEAFFKNQVHTERSGQLFVQCRPYTHFTNFDHGTNHATPYEYDTHVPLVLYQKDRYTDRTINRKVWIPQAANTIAHILDVNRPSASTLDVLPGTHEGCGPCR